MACGCKVSWFEGHCYSFNNAVYSNEIPTSISYKHKLVLLIFVRVTQLTTLHEEDVHVERLLHYDILQDTINVL